ncbi:MAG: hypothetical protein EBS18_02540 [Actinobacteria bacterium]|nr:hypothetical protein [Actinomycetota bacterium]
MHEHDHSEDELPLRVTYWDILALVSSLFLNIFLAITNFFSGLTNMLIAHADFVDDKLSFHEYAARTIEKLRKGE